MKEKWMVHTAVTHLEEYGFQLPLVETLRLAYHREINLNSTISCGCVASTRAFC